MGKKHSIAAKKRLGDDPAGKMSLVAKGRWNKPENKDPAKRTKIALNMVEARKNKKV